MLEHAQNGMHDKNNTSVRGLGPGPLLLLQVHHPSAAAAGRTTTPKIATSQKRLICRQVYATENGATTISSDHDSQHLLKGLHVYSGAITVQAHVFSALQSPGCTKTVIMCNKGGCLQATSPVLHLPSPEQRFAAVADSRHCDSARTARTQ
jgi:hypothetical protein